MKNQTLIERVLLLKLRDEKWYNCFFFFFYCVFYFAHLLATTTDTILNVL